MDNYFLFIIWKNARWCEKTIIKDIQSAFEIVKTFEIHWKEDEFQNRLEAFYGVKLPINSNKMRHCGCGPFLLILVKDQNPCYENRKTSVGTEFVNVNMFDKKTLYRNWTGGGHRIHCSNTAEETLHDLYLMLNLYPEEVNEHFQYKHNIIHDVPPVNGCYNSAKAVNRLLDVSYNTLYFKCNNKYFIITECREEIIRELHPVRIEMGLVKFWIEDQEYHAYILGAREGDIDVKLLNDCLSKNAVDEFLISNIDAYTDVVWRKEQNSSVDDYFKNKGYIIPDKQISTLFSVKNDSLAKRGVQCLKLLKAKVINLWR